MSGAAALISALKKTLKAHSIPYRKVAGALDLSEASVKRLFSQRNFTLERLERICQLMDLTIADLVKIADAENPAMSELTEAQEKELVSDFKLLLVAVLVIEGWVFEDILTHYDLTEPEAIQRLARLDRLKLIELLPKNRIKLLIAPNFAWRKNGPIEKFFTQNVKEAFLRSRFDQSDEALLFLYGLLSDRSNAVIQRRLEQVAKEFNELHQEDLQLPLEQRQGCSMILAIRPWDFFAAIRRADAVQT